MSSNVSMREFALKFDLDADQVYGGSEFARQQRDAAALKAGHVLLPALIIIGGREIYVLPPDQFQAKAVPEFRKCYFPAQADRHPSSYGFLKFPGTAASHDGYTIHGTVDFGVHLSCGASDGVDAAPVKRGRNLYSLGMFLIQTAVGDRLQQREV